MNRGGRTGILLIFCVFSSTCFLIAESNVISQNFVRPTEIQVGVLNEDTSKELCVECEVNFEQKVIKACFNANAPFGTLRWTFPTKNHCTVFCSASWGSSHLERFPVFGDGVPSKDSSWIIDKYGKRRIMEDGFRVVDFFGKWDDPLDNGEWWEATTVVIETPDRPIDEYDFHWRQKNN